MRGFWPLLVIGALLLLPGVRGDPAVSSPGPAQGLATWTFSNPANYTTVNATLAGGAASLAWTASASMDASAADFEAGLHLVNVNVSSPNGDVVIADTSQPGPVRNLVWQPDPANVSDNYLDQQNGGKPNWGTAPNLVVGNWGGSAWGRAVLEFPRLPLPSNATLVGATLQLYFYDPIVPGLMYFSAHRLVDNWTEMESNWNTRDGVTPWTAAGGDFDPTALDTSAGVGTTPGWFTWNITSLAIGWWTGSVPNDGLMVRQVGDTTSTLGQKGFYSSDSAEASLRPRLLLSYTTPGSTGHFESRTADAGGKAVWGRVAWNATLPSGTYVAVRTRSGDTASVDATWSPWSALASAPNSPILSPPGRYLQYSLDLFTTSTASPSVHDVSLGFGRFPATARIDTQDFGPAWLQAWGDLSLNASLPSGTSAVLQYSQDSGSSWLPASSGTNLSSALVRPIRVRVLLATDNTTTTPSIRSVTLAYRVSVAPNGPPGNGPLDVTTGAEIVGIGALAALAMVGALFLVLRLRAAAFHPIELFLIHADGRLIARVGTEEMQDEFAATAVFTLVLTFVRDSFRGPEGTGGELKSLQVDEHDVSIVGGRFLYLALVSEGPRPTQLSPRMYAFLSRLEAAHGGRLERWNGLREGNEALEAELARFLQKGYRRARPGGYRA